MSQPRPRGVWLCALLLASGGCAAPDPKPHDRPSEDIQAATARAEQRYEAADWPAAAEAYGVLVAAMPEDVDLRFRYANALARSEQPARAVNAYREVVTRDKHYAKAWFNMGIVQLRDAAASFSGMNTHVSTTDPLRSQSEQIHRDIMQILESTTGTPAPTRRRPGPVAPATLTPPPLNVAPQSTE